MVKSSIIRLAMILVTFLPKWSRADVQDLTDRANFIFTAAVEKLNASTDPALIAPSPSSVIVKVNEVLKGSNLAVDVKGKEITVQLATETKVQLKQPILFFTNVLVSGKSLVVQEVSHADLERNENLVSQVVDAISQKPDRELQRRLDQADLVVTGTVMKTRLVKGREFRVQNTTPSGLKR